MVSYPENLGHGSFVEITLCTYLMLKRASCVDDNKNMIIVGIFIRKNRI